MPVSSLPPSKKRKITLGDDKTVRVQQLETDLSHAISKNTSLNTLVDLLEIAKNAKDPQLSSKSIYALYRVFVLLITSGRLALQGDESAKVVRGWIWERLNAYTDLLVILMTDQEKSLKISSLQILFSLLKHLSTSLSPTQKSTPSSSKSSSQPHFHVSYFDKIISGLLLCPTSGRENARLDPDVLDAFVDTWFNVHDDIRWFFLRDAVTFLTKHPTNDYPDVAENLLNILERLKTFPTEASELNEWWVPELGVRPPPRKSSKKSQEAGDDEAESDEAPEDEDDWRKFFDEPESSTKPKNNGPAGRLHKMTVHQSLHSLASHRAVFSRAWLTLLPQLSEVGKRDAEKSKALSVKALNMMHRGVLPHLTRPIMIMDWVGSCVDYGGTVGLLALNALFILMKDYNLDYPSFYTRLYSFLDEGLLHHKHRARFFRLTELFLSSTHLPATLLASFIKRLSRLSLTAPPAAIIMIIPFTYNTLKRHPVLMVMINRIDDPLNKDPFDPHDKDPMTTKALESSLWELVTHRNHYHPSVSTLAKIFQEAFRKQSYDMEDFMDHTYGTLFDSEVKRKIKKEPAVTMELKQYTFPPADGQERLAEELVVKGDVVAELWTF